MNTPNQPNAAPKQTPSNTPYNTPYAKPYTHASEDASGASSRLERDMLLDEFNNDRDAILTAIKESLRNENYDDAQSFIYKYRAAANTDDEFRILAKVTAQKLEQKRKISKIETVLDVTPDDAWQQRLALYDKILQISPDNKHYQKLMDEALIKLNQPPKYQQQDSAPALPTNFTKGLVPAFCAANIILALCTHFPNILSLSILMIFHAISLKPSNFPNKNPPKLCALIALNIFAITVFWMTFLFFGF